MLQKIRPSIILILSILNSLIIFVLFLIISNVKADYKYNSVHQKLSENRNIPNIYNETNKYYINNDIDDKESTFSKYFFDNSSYFTSILILNILCSYFLLLLIFSFCTGENDCCYCCEGACYCSNSNGNCSCNNSDGGKAMLICLIFICLILAIYYSLKCCGKHFARYISITSISFFHLCIFFLSLLALNGENKDIFRIMTISGISALINLLTIILPNIHICKMLRYNGRILSSEINNSNIIQNQNQLSQINNNVMAINNNMNNYGNLPIQVNYDIYSNNNQINQVPVVNNEYPVVNNEYNGASPNLERNVNINYNDSNNKYVEENNKEMGMAPLPAFEMQPKN